MYGQMRTVLSKNQLSYRLAHWQRYELDSSHDMSNPNALGDPDTYQGTNWYTGTDHLTYLTLTPVSAFYVLPFVNGIWV